MTVPLNGTSNVAKSYDFRLFGVYELYEGVRTLYQNGAFDPSENNSDNNSRCFLL